MSFQSSIQAAKKAAFSHPARFAEARCTHPAIAPFENAQTLLAALSPSSALSEVEQSLVVAAVVAEQRARRHPLWSALLVAAFEPMLGRIRARVGRPNDKDLDQRVLLAFLEVVTSDVVAFAGRFAILAVRRATEGAVFAGVRRDRKAPRDEAFEDEAHAAPPAEDDVDVAVREAQVRDFFRRHGADDELVLALVAVVVHHEPLRDHVADRFADRTEAERTAVYERLRAARRRLLLRIGAHASPARLPMAA